MPEPRLNSASEPRRSPRSTTPFEAPPRPGKKAGSGAIVIKISIVFKLNGQLFHGLCTQSDAGLDTSYLALFPSAYIPRANARSARILDTCKPHPSFGSFFLALGDPADSNFALDRQSIWCTVTIEWIQRTPMDRQNEPPCSGSSPAFGMRVLLLSVDVCCWYAAPRVFNHSV